MHIHANFQDATIYNKKVTMEEAELFDQPLWKYFTAQYTQKNHIKTLSYYYQVDSGRRPDIIRYYGLREDNQR